MAFRKFLDISTAHLSPAAKAWLSESATLNHAANYHGTGSGAALGCVGATLYGWFMAAPELPEADGIDHGIPDEMHPIIKHAQSLGCGYILFDADADIIEGLPLFNDDDIDLDPEDETISGDDNEPDDDNPFDPESPEGRAWDKGRMNSDGSLKN